MHREDLLLIILLGVLPTLLTIGAFIIQFYLTGAWQKAAIIVGVILALLTLVSYFFIYYIFQMGKMGK